MSLINNKYIIHQQIGSGSFGTIYKGENVRTNEKVAIKVEPIKNNTRLLKNESTVYQYLTNSAGIPHVKWFGKDEFNYYMVINLLGDSLQKLVDWKGRFSLKLTLQIGIQLIYLLKTIHDKGLVHRDVKPDNFLLGLNDRKTQFNIIDFGFCKSYLNNGLHIALKQTNSLIGSFSYASINAHNFMELSRRDDLESLGYILLYIYLGKLEWQKENEFENPAIRYKKNNMIKNMKLKIINDTTIPNTITEYMKSVRSLEFEEKPNYAILVDMFKREVALL